MNRSRLKPRRGKMQRCRRIHEDGRVCGHPVSLGDRHRQGHCPAPRSANGKSAARALYLSAQHRATQVADLGVAIERPPAPAAEPAYAEAAD